MNAIYTVELCNQDTGETLYVTVRSTGPVTAQVDALTQAFRTWGWRKTVAGHAVALPSAVGE